MSLSKFSRGYREFVQPEGIPGLIKGSRNYGKGGEDLSTAESLLIFQTSNQHTWLLATSHRFYVILDDIRKKEPSIIRSISKRRLIDDSGELKLRLGERPRSERTGLVDMEGYKALLFSHRLFMEERVTESMERLIKGRMGH